MNKTYAEKLRDPRWQRRRTEVLQKYDFTCGLCEDSKNELHVHHLLYRRNTDPWDYPDHELIALCKDCHKSEEEARSELLSLLGKFPPESPLSMLLDSIKRIYERDPWEIWNWFMVSRYPDLVEEASKRRIAELEQEHGS